MYCNISDLLTRVNEKTLINLSKDEPPYDKIDEKIITENIEVASDLVDASIRNKYTLPLVNVPSVIKQITADIVIYRLYSRRAQDIPQNYVKNYEFALSLLSEFQCGSKILKTDTEENLGSCLYLTDKQESDVRFSKEKLRGFNLWTA